MPSVARAQVPGEMFALALEAKARGMGVVGSTQNILDFISAKLAEALQRPFPERLQARPGAARRPGAGRAGVVGHWSRCVLRGGVARTADKVVVATCSYSQRSVGRGGAGLLQCTLRQHPTHVRFVRRMRSVRRVRSRTARGHSQGRLRLPSVASKAQTCSVTCANWTAPGAGSSLTGVVRCWRAGGAGDGVRHDHRDRAQGAGDAARVGPFRCRCRGRVPGGVRGGHRWWRRRGRRRAAPAGRPGARAGAGRRRGLLRGGRLRVVPVHEGGGAGARRCVMTVKGGCALEARRPVPGTVTCEFLRSGGSAALSCASVR